MQTESLSKKVHDAKMNENSALVRTPQNISKGHDSFRRFISERSNEETGPAAALHPKAKVPNKNLTRNEVPPLEGAHRTGCGEQSQVASGDMSKRSPEEAGLAGLLGGYGSGSDDDDDGSPTKNEETPVGGGGEERASDGQALAGLIGVDDDDGEDADDEPMAGPAMPSAHEMQAAYATLGTYPDEPGAHREQGDDGKEAGESDDDEPMAGPARPDAMQARMAYTDTDPEPHRTPSAGEPAEEPATAPGPSSVTLEVTPRVHSAPASLVAKVKMPPAPEGECLTYMAGGESLQSKTREWLELKRRGISINDRIRDAKGFRNPDFLQSVVDHFKVDDRGTMFAPEIFDPSVYPPEDYYDELASAQRRENERREKERRELGLDRSMDFASAGFVAAPAQPVSAVTNGVAGGGKERSLIDAAIAQAREKAEAAARDARR